MERKRGEIFKYNGEWYQCVKGRSCNCCDLLENGLCVSDFSLTGNCFSYPRKDKTNVLFKKLKKVGEPYTTFVDKTVQNYLLETAVSVPPKDVFTLINNEQRLIAIEIEQNKEDMEEKKDNYDGYMDKECIPICDALNSIPNVQTTESCCGKEPCY